jgi:hypothetical protein
MHDGPMINLEVAKMVRDFVPHGDDLQPVHFRDGLDDLDAGRDGMDTFVRLGMIAEQVEEDALLRIDVVRPRPSNSCLAARPPSAHTRSLVSAIGDGFSPMKRKRWLIQGPL